MSFESGLKMMFARIFDKAEGFFYKSIIYGRIGDGQLGYFIVYNPRREAFVLVDHFDRASKDIPKPMVQTISLDKSGCVTREKVHVLKLNRFFKSNGFNFQIDEYCGYDDVYQDYDFMLRILRDKIVPKCDCSIEIREPEDADQWTYMRTQWDADQFTSAFTGFHDAELKMMQYVEDGEGGRLIATFGGFHDGRLDKMQHGMDSEESPHLEVSKDSLWHAVVELCFEGLLRLNLWGPAEGFSREIFNACLFVNDECVFWADGDLDGEDLQYDGTYIKAINLKWRKIG